MPSSGWSRAPMWDEWRRLTKFMGTAHIAFAETLARAPMAGPEIRMLLGDGPKPYRTSVADHRKALGDLHTLHTLVLVGSFSLVESHCRLVRLIARDKNWSLLDGRVPSSVLAAAEQDKLKGGIEAWAQDLLDLVGQDWPTGHGNKAGLVETAIVRNLAAHGRATVDAADLAYAVRRGAKLPFEIGQPIRIDYPLLNNYRGHLRQFCRTVSDGVVHMARGTHRNPVVVAVSTKAVGKSRKARSQAG